MIQTIQRVNEIPHKNAIIKKLEGRVTSDNFGIKVGNTRVPGRFHRKFRERCNGYSSVQEAVDDKNLYLRGNENGWFGLVTDEFNELPIAEIAANFNTDIIARYIPQKERVLLNIPIGEIPTPKSKQDGFEKNMHFYVDSGDYGTYGGNGQSALRYGISVNDLLCTNWTLFLSDMFDVDQKVIHKNGYPTVEGLIEKMNEFGDTVKDKWATSDELMYSTEILSDYFAKYGARTGNTRWLAKEIDLSNDVVSAYDVAWNLTHKAQERNSYKQAQMEMLAGELIICYDKIVEEFAN